MIITVYYLLVYMGTYLFNIFIQHLPPPLYLPSFLFLKLLEQKEFFVNFD